MPPSSWAAILSLIVGGIVFWFIAVKLELGTGIWTFVISLAAAGSFYGGMVEVMAHSNQADRR